MIKLQQMAKDGATFDALVTQATSIVKGDNARHRHYEEDYQDSLRELKNASAKDPHNASALAALGTFLYRNALNVPGEVVEPRAAYRHYRAIDAKDQEQEIALAEQYLDTALVADPRNMLAITGKAEALIGRGQWADAETLLRQAMAIKGSDPNLLDLFARIMDHAASVRDQKAAVLRTPIHWSDAMYYWTRFPSQAELEQADEYDQQADQLWNIANQAMQSTAQALKGTARGWNYAAVIARCNGAPTTRLRTCGKR